MGKSRKRLAVLLAATMVISMMTGFTSFAAEEGTEESSVDVGLNGTMPDATTPDTSTPDATTPDTTTPDATTSDTTTPDATVPDTDGTDEETPDTDVTDEDFQDTEAADGADEPEESETTVWIDNNWIEEKDEFVSLGENKGEYKYYNGTLVLKNVVIEVDPQYGGAAIAVVGTLVIDLQGDNYLTTTGNSVLYANLYDYTEKGKENMLTITGDGSLTISNKGDGEIDEEQLYLNGVEVYGGDLVIDGAEVTSDVYNSWTSAAIWVSGGDVVITNGADVTAKSTAVEDVMDHYGIYAGGGKISVTNNSEVYASADGDISDLAKLVAAVYDPIVYSGGAYGEPWGTEYWSDKICDSMLYAYYLGLVKDAKAQLGIGMHSDGTFDPELLENYMGGIFIDDSNVRSIGSFASMLVKGLNATIRINDSTIVSPDDVNVRELMAVIGDDPDAAAEIIGAILAKGEGSIDMDAIMEKVDKLAREGKKDELEDYLTTLFDSIAKDVNIVRDAELQTQKAGLGIPTTGDNFRAEGLLFAMLAAGTVIAYCVRRKVSA